MVGVVGYLNILFRVDAVCFEDVVEDIFGRCALSGRAYLFALEVGDALDAFAVFEKRKPRFLPLPES